MPSKCMAFVFYATWLYFVQSEELLFIVLIFSFQGLIDRLVLVNTESKVHSLFNPEQSHIFGLRLLMCISIPQFSSLWCVTSSGHDSYQWHNQLCAILASALLHSLVLVWHCFYHRLLSILTCCLDTCLLLNTQYHFQDILLNCQSQNALEGRYVLSMYQSCSSSKTDCTKN